MSKSFLDKLGSPVLGDPPKEYRADTFRQLVNTLRIFFVRVTTALNTLVGTHGGRFIDFPYTQVFDDADQALAAVDTAQAVRFSVDQTVNGMAMEPTQRTELRVTHAGVYLLTFRAQLVSTSGAAQVVHVWARVSGVAVAGSARPYSVPAGASVGVDWSASVALTDGEYIEVVWSGGSTDLTLKSTAAAGSVPAIAGAALGATHVSALPENLS